MDGECVLRYDNEAGKGDHRHACGAERTYRFESVEKLMADFERDIARWRDENRREIARRVHRDVQAVHADVHALLRAGIVSKTPEARVLFPYEAIHVDFVLHAIA